MANIRTKTKDDKLTGTDPLLVNPETVLNDADLDKVSGGQALLEAYPKFSWLPPVPAGPPFMKISGPAWVNLMTYRKKGADAEPSRKASVTELYQALTAEPTAKS